MLVESCLRKGGVALCPVFSLPVKATGDRRGRTVSEGLRRMIAGI